jgi:hypothetical protein
MAKNKSVDNLNIIRKSVLVVLSVKVVNWASVREQNSRKGLSVKATRVFETLQVGIVWSIKPADLNRRLYVLHVYTVVIELGT